MEKQMNCLVKALIDNKIIHPSMKEHYIYAAEVLVERTNSIVTMIVIGLCMRKLIVYS